MGEDEDIDPVYSDLFAKYTQTLSSKHEMQLSLLRSTGEFDLLEDDADECRQDMAIPMRGCR